MRIARSRPGRLSAGAAITFAVSAIAGVAGNRVTGQVTPALVVFVLLVVAGMGLSYWLDRRAGSADGGGDGQGARATAAGIVRQDIIAAGPGSVASGALGGNVINHGEPPQAGPHGSARSDPLG